MTYKQIKTPDDFKEYIVDCFKKKSVYVHVTVEKFSCWKYKREWKLPDNSKIADFFIINIDVKFKKYIVNKYSLEDILKPLRISCASGGILQLHLELQAHIDDFPKLKKWVELTEDYKKRVDKAIKQIQEMKQKELDNVRAQSKKKHEADYNKRESLQEQADKLLKSCVAYEREEYEKHKKTIEKKEKQIMKKYGVKYCDR